MSDTLELDIQDIAESLKGKETTLAFTFATVEYGHSIVGLPTKDLSVMDHMDGPIDLGLHIDTQMQLFEDTARVIRDSGVKFARADFIAVGVNKSKIQLLYEPEGGKLLDSPKGGRLTLGAVSERITDQQVSIIRTLPDTHVGHLLKVHIETEDDGTVVIKGSVPKNDIKDFGNKVARPPYKEFSWSRVDADASGTPGYRVTGEFASGVRVDLISHD